MTKIIDKFEYAGKVSDSFAKGQYKSLVQAYERTPSSLKVEDLPYVIGALSFLGQTFEAQALYKAQQKNLTELGHASSLFFLGVGITRKSLYKKARLIFKKNQELYAKNPDPEIAFYTYQGIAFYLFLTGQFFRCEKFTTKAFELSVAAGNAQLKVLAQDLLAHTLIATGKVHSGLELLRDSHRLATSLKNIAFAAATRVSILLVEAEHGHRPAQIIRDLELCLEELDAQDSYSKSNLMLELARQKTMRGQWAQAEALLNQQAPVIFASENRRQEITLNLHWAKLAFLRGHYVLAWQYLRSAQLRLHEVADRNLEVQILSMEVDILEEQKNPLASVRKDHLLALSASYSSQINRNMLARKKWRTEPISSEDDAIHNILSEIHSFPQKAVKLVMDSGYYSWLYKCLPLQKGRSYLLLGVQKNSLCLISPEGIELHRFTESSQKLLEVLQKGPLSKESLVKQLWGYEYHPLRHDNLVYSAMSALRKALGSKHTWIQTLDLGYQLQSGIQILHAGKNGQSDLTERANIKKSVDTGHLVDSQLNYRQIQALEYLQEHRFLNTRDYKGLFSTSEITASRDLGALNRKGYVLKIGFGRSTQYTLPGGKRI